MSEIVLYRGAYTGVQVDAAISRALAGGEIDTEIASLKSAVGSPLMAATVADMTDTSKIYVYTGSETGYVNGNWYFWNGTAWESGGQYLSGGYVFDAVPTDGSTNPVESNGIYDAVTALRKLILASFATGTASGAIASFDDGADGVPVKSLTVQITPVQEGSGDPSPSNVRPISGWTGISVYNYGNEYDGTYISSSDLYLRPTGNVMTVTALSSGDPPRSIVVPVQPSTKYHIKSGISGTMRVGGFASVPVVSNTTSNFATATDTENPVELEITTSATAQYLFIQFFIDADISARDANLTEALTGFSYGAVTTYTVTWATEVFAGTATYIGDGKWSIQITHVAMPSLSTLGWSYTANGGFFNVGVGWLHLDGSKRDTLICNKYKTLTPAASVLDDNCIGITLGGDSLRIRDSRYTDPATFKATLSDAVCYAPLLEAYYPTPVIVDGADPSTLLGNNNMWSDAGDISVTYRADPTLIRQN